jgi:RNA-directed DNA polymerase
VTHELRKSDSSIVPQKHPNKGTGLSCPAEAAEGRELTKGNTIKRSIDCTQGQASMSQSLNRVRLAAERKAEKLNALWHHVYNKEGLRASYYGLKRNSATGIDHMTWSEYGKNLESNLEDLSKRLRNGGYRAQPVKRINIPKPDGRFRPIGIPVLEDKLVQKAVAEVLNAVYESEFKNFSYGFRPGRRQHDALDAVAVGIEKRKINWILDADIQGFFDALDHDMLIEFIAHRISDKRVIRQIRKWLKAGVLEEGELKTSYKGTPQGGSISPLLANIYLHYVLDLWVKLWRKRTAKGDVIIVRYADDFIVGFQYYKEAVRFKHELKARLSKFKLKLHPQKTRLIEFGRFASKDREDRGKDRPETFNFLGFTHICGKTKAGRFKLKRKTMSQKMRRKIAEIKQEMRDRLNNRISEVGKWLRSVLLGHYRYYGVPGNIGTLYSFREALLHWWYKALKRRGQRRRISWDKMVRIAKDWLPYPEIYHPYPGERLIVRT